jgi:hypothetical protein
MGDSTGGFQGECERQSAVTHPDAVTTLPIGDSAPLAHKREGFDWPLAGEEVSNLRQLGIIPDEGRTERRGISRPSDELAQRRFKVVRQRRINVANR